MNSRIFALGKENNTIIIEATKVVLREDFFYEMEEKYGYCKIDSVKTGEIATAIGDLYVYVTNSDKEIPEFAVTEEDVKRELGTEIIETDSSGYCLDREQEMRYLHHIASTILEQSGPNVFFGLPGEIKHDIAGVTRLGMGGINTYFGDGEKMTVILNYGDLYDVYFYRKDGTLAKEIKDLYFDSLPELAEMYEFYVNGRKLKKSDAHYV